MASDLREQVDPAEFSSTDFYAWVQHQAEALRQFQATRPNAPIDFAHLIDQVTGLVDANFVAVESQLRRIIIHFLELEYSPAEPPRPRWAVSISDLQAAIDDRLTPAVRHDVEARLERLDAEARRIAEGEFIDRDEPGAAASLQETCRCTLDQLLDKTRCPTDRHDLVDDLL